MERIEAMVPPPLQQDIKRYCDRRGYENKSQAIRELLRQGLNQENQAVVADD